MKNPMIVLLSAGLFIFSCGDDPVSSSYDDSYTPLTIGDVTQLIFLSDSSTILLEIIGTTQRTDGLSVCICGFKYGKSSLDTSYYCIKDGYLVATELEPVQNDPLLILTNPFREQRIAKSHPSDGDRWIHTPGEADTIWCIAIKVDAIDVPAGHFKNVFAFNIAGFLTVYYSQRIGWIGSDMSFITSPGPDFSCSYKNVNGNQYGYLFPPKDPRDVQITASIAKVQAGFLFGIPECRPNGEQKGQPNPER